MANVAVSDAVVCVIDSRYGGVLKSGKYTGRSATEAEVRHARELVPPKPVLFFMRDFAFQEFEQLRGNPAYDSKWVKGDADRLKRWTDFVEYAVRLPEHVDRSNWCDRFRAVSDLKPLVLKRLVEQFPSQAVSVAMQPDGLVRVSFRTGRRNPGHVEGWFENVGTGPALNLHHGICRSSVARPETSRHRGGLAEGDSIKEWDGAGVIYPISNAVAAVMFCEYENRFGDCYRVETDFQSTGAGHPLDPSGRDRVFIRSPAGDWIQVT